MILHKKAFLVIDDDAAMLRAVNKVLRGEGASVLTSSSLREAVNHLRDGPMAFNAVLTDLRLRDGEGRTILKSLKSAAPDVPLIVITAFSRTGLEEECRASGAAAFLEKPLDTTQLLEAIFCAAGQESFHPIPGAPTPPLSPCQPLMPLSPS